MVRKKSSNYEPCIVINMWFALKSLTVMKRLIIENVPACFSSHCIIRFSLGTEFSNNFPWVLFILCCSFRFLFCFKTGVYLHVCTCSAATYYYVVAGGFLWVRYMWWEQGFPWKTRYSRSSWYRWEGWRKRRKRRSRWSDSASFLCGNTAYWKSKMCPLSSLTVLNKG